MLELLRVLVSCRKGLRDSGYVRVAQGVIG